ncbi:MAG: hypothetical protein H7Z37_18855, partial [Pyrinomonadaceae bacterium]|nr:hypothetical protein [Pyrinomonadaceae bacterium]
MRTENVTKSIKLKVCGMREPENITAVSSIKPDFFGLIFYEKSPRFVSLESAKTLP